jgi:TetR/AcrR family transcriptional regulator, transcriptional repressor for nem operon
MTEATKTLPAAAKPRDGKSTREAVLEAATRLMHVQGYQNTSLDDVLRESGVGKGNFYHHFRSKEDLGYAILDQVIVLFLEKTLEPCFSAADVPRLAQIRCFLDRVLEAQRQRKCVGGCAMGNLASELSDVHEGFRARLASVFTAWRERLTVALREAQERGEVVEACDPESVGHLLVAALEGAILLSKVSKDIAVMEQCVIELKRYLTLYEVRP